MSNQENNKTKSSNEIENEDSKNSTEVNIKPSEPNTDSNDQSEVDAPGRTAGKAEGSLETAEDELNKNGS